MPGSFCALGGLRTSNMSSWSTALPYCAVQWDNICNWQPFKARSVLLPPPLWKDPTCCPVGSVIPSSHKGHICEWRLLGFHTKEPQQASINGLQAAELCSNVPTLCPLEGWVHKEKTPAPGPPAVHLIWVYHESTFLLYPSCLKDMQVACLIYLWDSCNYHNTTVTFQTLR